MRKRQSLQENYAGIAHGGGSAAIAYFDSEINKNSRNEQAHFYKGELYYKAGQYKEALTCFNKVIEINSNYPDIYQRHTDIMMKLSCEIPLLDTISVETRGLAEELNKLMSGFEPEKSRSYILNSSTSVSDYHGVITGVDQSLNISLSDDKWSYSKDLYHSFIGMIHRYISVFQELNFVNRSNSQLKLGEYNEFSSHI